MSIIEKLHLFADCVEIVHHIPGRIRMRLLLNALPELDASTESLLSRVRNFKEALENIPGVNSIRINTLAQSCTIEYDRNTIPFQAWPDLLTGVPSEAASVLKHIIIEKYAEVTCV